MSPQEMMDLGMLLVGSVDSVTRQLEAMLSHDPVRWLFAWQFNGLIPHDKLMRSLEAVRHESAAARQRRRVAIRPPLSPRESAG